jgi:hypothetical protein
MELVSGWTGRAKFVPEFDPKHGDPVTGTFWGYAVQALPHGLPRPEAWPWRETRFNVAVDARLVDGGWCETVLWLPVWGAPGSQMLRPGARLALFTSDDDRETPVGEFVVDREQAGVEVAARLGMGIPGRSWLYAGAYWGARNDSAADAAGRWRCLLDGLRVLGVEGCWGPVTLPEVVDRWNQTPTRDQLTRMLKLGDEPGDNSPACGRPLYLIATGDFDVRLTGWVGAGGPGQCNRVVISFARYSDHEAELTDPDWLRRVLELLVGVWSPDWAVVGPCGLYSPVSAPLIDEVSLGWLTYLKDQQPLEGLAHGSMIPFGDGAMIQAGPNALDLDEHQAVALRDELRGHGVPV